MKTLSHGRQDFLVLLLLLLLGIFNSYAQGFDVRIDPHKSFQTINHFTASDAWSGNFAGMYFGNQEKEQIADWLFSTASDSAGNPIGIGLSMWRVNLGAGTLEQDNAEIKPFQRRAESLMTKDGKCYDWDKMAGQQYFMKKAAELGCNSFLLFSNSPLVQYTKNHKGYADDYSSNLRSECYDAYADYLASVAEHFITVKGWNIRFISPINEPQCNWVDPRQEGSPWLNPEIKRMVVSLDKALTSHHLDNVTILTGEANSLQSLIGVDEWVRNNFKNNPELPGYQIESFFDSTKTNYIGNLQHLPRLIGGHSYGSHTTNKNLREVRENIKKVCDEYDVHFYQTEWCMLPSLQLPMDGFTSDWVRGNYGGMDVALQMARIIHADLCYANAEGWGYWKGMEINGDHALIALYPKDGSIMNGGSVASNKLLWALGNYSRFIRPGFRRISLTGADDLDNVVASAYISPENKKIVTVCVNSSFENRPFSASLPSNNRITEIKAYRTSESMNLANISDCVKSGKVTSLNLPARSITTLVFTLK